MKFLLEIDIETAVSLTASDVALHLRCLADQMEEFHNTYNSMPPREWADDRCGVITDCGTKIGDWAFREPRKVEVL